MVSDHELVSIEVDPPVLPAEVEAHALAARRGKALSQNTDRLLLLLACAVSVERYAERLFWRGAGTARTSTAVVNVGWSVRLACSTSSLLSTVPDVSGVAASLTSLRRWDERSPVVEHAVGSQPLPSAPRRAVISGLASGPV